MKKITLTIILLISIIIIQSCQNENEQFEKVEYNNEINNSNSSEEMSTNNDNEETYIDDASNENNEQNLCELCGRKKDVLKSYCWICENKNNAIKNENPFTESEAIEMEEADEIFNRSKSHEKVSAEEFGRAAQTQFSTRIRANQR